MHPDADIENDDLRHLNEEDVAAAIGVGSSSSEHGPPMGMNSPAVEYDAAKCRNRFHEASVNRE